MLLTYVPFICKYVLKTCLRYLTTREFLLHQDPNLYLHLAILYCVNFSIDLPTYTITIFLVKQLIK